MILNLTKSEQSDSYLCYIAPELESEFEVQTLSSYESYVSSRDFCLIPYYLSDDEDFVDWFGPSDYLLMESHMIEEYGLGCTEDQEEEFRSGYDYSDYSRGPEILWDIELVLDRFQLFYVNIEREYDPDAHEYIETLTYTNSPLQEVW